jgi:hypothetical protein
MKCPICDTLMDEGEVYLKKSFFNTLAFGWGATDLMFKRKTPKKEIELMTPWDFSKAYHCSACGATTIATGTGKR